MSSLERERRGASSEHANDVATKSPQPFSPITIRHVFLAGFELPTRSNEFPDPQRVVCGSIRL